MSMCVSENQKHQSLVLIDVLFPGVPLQQTEKDVLPMKTVL